MALAILKWLDSDDSVSRFQVDIGSNHFYSYEIGDGKIKQVNGLKLLEKVNFSSRLITLGEETLGRSTLEIPNHFFDRENRYIQLFSFRTSQKIGPAISDIIQLPIIPNTSTQDMALGLEVIMENQTPVESSSFSYQEVSPISVEMGVWDTVKKTASSVYNEIKEGVEVVKRDPSVVKKALETIAAYPPVQGKLIKLQKDVTDKTGINKEQLKENQTLQNLWKIAKKAKDNYDKTAVLNGSKMAQAQSSNSGYTSSLSLTALLQSPQMIELLGKAVTPETVKTLIQTADPTKIIGTITNGLVDLGKLGLEDAKQIQGHNLALLKTESPQDKLNAKFLEGLSLANVFSPNSVALNYRRVNKVRLDFVNVKPVMLQGRSQVVYHQNQDLSFPLGLRTPKPIAKGMVQLLVKDAHTLEILIEEKFHVTNVGSGELNVTPTISRNKLEFLKPNKNYLVSAVLVWKGKSKSARMKKRLGTSMTQLIYLMGDYTFDRLEGHIDTVSLNDVNRFRSYWHKIWQGSLSRERQRLSFDCKYYYVLEPKRYNLARMETLTKIEQIRRVRQEGQLKTGMILNLASLNQLLNQVSYYSQLNSEQMKALHCPEFVKQFHHAARTQVEFDGDRGDDVALWVYPEMRLQEIMLKKVQKTDYNGQVTAINEEPIFFPMPSVVHFIGTIY